MLTFLRYDSLAVPVDFYWLEYTYWHFSTVMFFSILTLLYITIKLNSVEITPFRLDQLQ